MKYDRSVLTIFLKFGDSFILEDIEKFPLRHFLRRHLVNTVASPSAISSSRFDSRREVI